MKLIGEMGARVEITIIGRTNSDSHDYWDANWIDTQIDIALPYITASYSANLRIEELQKFYTELVNLENISVKSATFNTMEEGLTLQCDSQSNGTVVCKGKARTVIGDSLEFKLNTDISSIGNFIADLQNTLKVYPLIGSLNE